MLKQFKKPSPIISPKQLEVVNLSELSGYDFMNFYSQNNQFYRDDVATIGTPRSSAPSSRKSSFTNYRNVDSYTSIDSQTSKCIISR